MTVIQMSERELTRLRVLIDLSDQRLTVEAAARLMGVGIADAVDGRGQTPGAPRQQSTSKERSSSEGI